MPSGDEDRERRLPAVRDISLPTDPGGGSVSPQPGGTDIIAYSMQQLAGVEGRDDIIVAAQREGLRLEAKRREGLMDSSRAEQEMDQFIEQAKDLCSTRNLDFEADADFQRASGKTRVTVRRKKRFLFF